MQELIGQIIEISNTGQFQIKVRCSQNLTVNAGQYFLIEFDPIEGRDPIRREVFLSSQLLPNEVVLYGNFLETATPGNKIKLYGPLGKGFQRPSGNKLVCVSLGLNLPILLSAASRYPNPQQKVVLVSNHPIDTSLIIENVEIRSLTELHELVDWCEDLLVEGMRDGDNIEKIMQIPSVKGINKQTQILIDSPMPCHGASDCGICKIKIWGQRYAICQDGPVIVMV